MKTCPTCTTENEDNAQFCERCGEPLTAKAKPSALLSPNFKKYLSDAAIIAAIIGLISTLLSVVLPMFKSEDTKATQTFEAMIIPLIETLKPSSPMPALPTPLPQTPTVEQEPLPSSSSPAPTPTAITIQTRLSTKDGMTLVLIPKGEFIMGSTDEDIEKVASQCNGCKAENFLQEKPKHTVYLDDYWIDIHEVTNAMFKKFVNDIGYQTEAETRGNSSILDIQSNQWVQKEGVDWQHPYSPESGIEESLDLPVVHVSWQDATAYCDWAGRSLPTEAEWEKAARGTDARIFPWGDTIDCNKANHVNCALNHLSPVDAFPQGASPYGVLDMAGNVSEWTADWYNVAYYASSAQENPSGPLSGSGRVIRGGAYVDFSWWLRTASRYLTEPTASSYILGFRCALRAETSQVVSQITTPSTPFQITENETLILTARALLTEVVLANTSLAPSVATLEPSIPIQTCLRKVPILGDIQGDTILCESFADNTLEWTINNEKEDEWSIDTLTIQDGKYRWDEVAKKGFTMRVPPKMDPVQDFEAALLAQRVQGDKDKACYALVFRWNDKKYYWFEVCDSQKFLVRLVLGDETNSLLDWQESDSIHPNKPNWLSVIARGDQFIFYINEQQVGVLQDDTLKKGKVGIGVDLESGEEATFEFDTFMLKQP